MLPSNRPLIELRPFLLFWGLACFAVNILVAFIVHEKQEQMQQVDSNFKLLKNAYKVIWDLMRNSADRQLVTVLLLCRQMIRLHFLQKYWLNDVGITVFCNDRANIIKFFNWRFIFTKSVYVVKRANHLCHHFPLLFGLARMRQAAESSSNPKKFMLMGSAGL